MTTAAAPRVSVVIPTFDRAELVSAAAESVLAQTFADLEAIVVDDGSTDRTVARLAAIGDPRLTVIAAAHGGCVGAVRNRGVGAARGEWLAFLDSDDLWVPDKLEAQLAALDRSGADWCYADHGLIGAPRRAGSFVPLSG